MHVPTSLKAIKTKDGQEFNRPSILTPVDIALVVGTVTGRDSLGPGVKEQFRRSSRDSKVSHMASLILVDGNTSPGDSTEYLDKSGEAVGLSKVFERRASFPWCTDKSIEVDDPQNTWMYHQFSPFTCKILEGLCVATEEYLPAFVAVVSEESLLRWSVFLENVAPSLPREKLVFTKIIPWEALKNGLPNHHYNPPHIGWYQMPHFNSSVVLSGDVASTLCKLYRAGPIKLYGPPELWFGQILATLEMLNWVDDVEGTVTLDDAKPSCSKGITITNIKTLHDWGMCQPSE